MIESVQLMAPGIPKWCIERAMVAVVNSDEMGLTVRVAVVAQEIDRASREPKGASFA